MTAALLHLLAEIPVEVPGVREDNGPHIVHLFNYMTSAYTFNARLYTGPTSTGSSRASLSLVLSPSAPLFRPAASLFVIYYPCHSTPTAVSNAPITGAESAW